MQLPGQSSLSLTYRRAAKTLSMSRPSRRREDQRLITGKGVFADDLNMPHQAQAVFIRSSVAHGILNSIDIEAARNAPGCIAACFTADDLAAAGIGNIPYLPIPGFAMPTPVDAPRPALAIGRVRHVGEPIALVVAETRLQAEDACELVRVDIATLPAAVDTASAVEPDAPRVWDERHQQCCAYLAGRRQRSDGKSF